MYKSKNSISLASCGTTTQAKCPPKCKTLQNEKKTMNNKNRLQEIEKEMTQLKCNTLCK